VYHSGLKWYLGNWRNLPHNSPFLYINERAPLDLGTLLLRDNLSVLWYVCGSGSNFETHWVDFSETRFLLPILSTAIRINKVTAPSFF
jgi:hypothetical protein